MFKKSKLFSKIAAISTMIPAFTTMSLASCSKKGVFALSNITKATMCYLVTNQEKIDNSYYACEITATLLNVKYGESINIAIDKFSVDDSKWANNIAIKLSTVRTNITENDLSDSISIKASDVNKSKATIKFVLVMYSTIETETQIDKTFSCFVNFIISNSSSEIKTSNVEVYTAKSVEYSYTYESSEPVIKNPFILGYNMVDDTPVSAVIKGIDTTYGDWKSYDCSILVIPNKVFGNTPATSDTLVPVVGIDDDAFNYDKYEYEDEDSTKHNYLEHIDWLVLDKYAIDGEKKHDGIETPLTSIGNNAFYNMNKLKGTLYIPKNVSNIGSRAFMGCSLIEKLLFSKAYNSEAIYGDLTIGDLAFFRCSNLSGSIHFPKVTHYFLIGNQAFASCNIHDIIFSTFKLASSFNEQDVDKDVIFSTLTISEQAFAYNSYLESVDFSRVLFVNPKTITRRDNFAQAFRDTKGRQGIAYNRLFVSDGGESFGNCGTTTKTPTVYIPLFKNTNLNIDQTTYKDVWQEWVVDGSFVGTKWQIEEEW